MLTSDWIMSQVFKVNIFLLTVLSFFCDIIGFIIVLFSCLKCHLQRWFFNKASIITILPNVKMIKNEVI